MKEHMAAFASRPKVVRTPEQRSFSSNDLDKASFQRFAQHNAYHYQNHIEKNTLHPSRIVLDTGIEKHKSSTLLL